MQMKTGTEIRMAELNNLLEWVRRERDAGCDAAVQHVGIFLRSGTWKDMHQTWEPGMRASREGWEG